MQFEWDDHKRIFNLRKHGIDFTDAKEIFTGYTVTVEDHGDYGEQRFISIGILLKRVIVIVHTEYNDTIRIISARKASKYEQRFYFSQIPD